MAKKAKSKKASNSKEMEATNKALKKTLGKHRLQMTVEVDPGKNALKIVSMAHVCNSPQGG